MNQVPTPTVAPTQYVVPQIHGDPAAAYRLAQAYLDVAESITATTQQIGHIIADLSARWSGLGRRGLDAPISRLYRDSARMVGALQDAAAALDAYGRHLEKAHHHHGFSLHKLLVIGAIVAVSGTALIVTVGAASLVEAAAATAAVGGATEAASAAAAADIAAAAEIDTALDATVTLRPLLAFAIPHLVQVEWASGAMAFDNEMTAGRLNWRGITETGAIAFVASGGSAQASSMAAESSWLSRAPAQLTYAMPQLIDGTAWAGAAAGEDALVDHRFSLADISETFVLAGASGPARDALRDRGMWPADRDYRREALINLSHQAGFIVDPSIAQELSILRQSVAELRRSGVDLRMYEGPGHTIDRHVGKSAAQLLARVRSSRLSAASTYWDETTAKDAIDTTVLARIARINRWVAEGSHGTLRLHLRVPYDIGFAIDTHGTVRFARDAVVVLRDDGRGLVVKTSYPVIRRAH